MSRWTLGLCLMTVCGLALPAQAKDQPITIGERIELYSLHICDSLSHKTRRFDRSCNLRAGDRVEVLSLHGEFVLLQVLSAPGRGKMTSTSDCLNGAAIIWKQDWYRKVRERAREEAAKDARRRAAEEAFKRVLKIPPAKK